MQIALQLDPDLHTGLGILEGVRDALRHYPDHTLTVIPSGQERLLTRLLTQNRLHGAIGAFISDRWLEPLPRTIPLINTSTLSRIRRVPSVIPDEQHIGRLAARHLIQAGCTTLLCLHDEPSYGARLRRKGFLRAAQQANIPVLPAIPQPLTPDTLPPRTGAYCTSDYHARTLATAALAAHIPIPQHLAIIGTGNNPADALLSPIPLTTIPHPLHQIGHTALNTLLTLATGARAPKIATRLPPQPIQIRTSTAWCHTPDPIISKALGHITQHLNTPPDIDALARYTGISRRGLEHRFRAHLGQAPAAVWREHQNNLALRLLTQTTLNLDQIADKCGYSSASHLSAAFKRANLNTPGSHRPNN